MADQATILAPSPPGSDEAPPHVRWWALLAAFAIFSTAVQLLVPKHFQDFIQTLCYSAWGVYFCLWLRRLDPKSKSIYWWIGGIALQSTEFSLTLIPNPGSLTGYAADALAFAFCICFVVSIFVIRAELVRYYNQQDDFTLVLSPWMTLFFSFAYFQSHLYDIAEYKRKAAEDLRIAT